MTTPRDTFIAGFFRGWKFHHSGIPNSTYDLALNAALRDLPPAPEETRTFLGTLPDGRRVLVTLHDGGLADAVVELAFRDQGHWGIPTTLTEEKA